MKFRIYIFMAMLLGLFTLNSNVFAADAANKTVNISESKNSVVFSGTITFAAADTADSYTTQTMESDWLDWEKAVFTVYTTALGAEDCNIFFQAGPSSDLTYMSTVYTQTAFDDVNVTTSVTWYAFQDTIGGSVYSLEWFVDPNVNMPFKVILFDGQTGNPALAVYTWKLYVPKLEGAPRTGAAGVSDST